MKKHILISSLPILILILILILIPIRANAQETLWESNGIPIRQGVHIEWQRTVCPGDNGSAIFVWSDTRNGSRNVFAQKVNSNGNLVVEHLLLGWIIVLKKKEIFLFNM